MTEESEPVEFVIHIIESPSPDDFVDGLAERLALFHTLEGAGLEVQLYTAVSEEALDRVFYQIGEYHQNLLEACENADDLPFPIIHLSAHGDKTGITLTSEESVTWADLARSIAPFNKVCGGSLIVGISSCEGFNGFEMAHHGTDLPFYALVGPIHEPTWEDATIAFSVFYHLVGHKLIDLDQAVEAMNLASGLDEGEAFKVILGPEARKKGRRLKSMRRNKRMTRPAVDKLLAELAKLLKA